MSKFAPIIPPDLIDFGKLDDFLLWLARLPVDLQTKKYILKAWCDLVEVDMRKEWVDYITAGRSHLTRG